MPDTVPLRANVALALLLGGSISPTDKVVIAGTRY